MLTFLSVGEIEEMERAGDINRNKERLAHELTALVHGRAEADKALEAARALFGGGGDSDNMPSTTLPADAFTDGAIPVIELLVRTGLAPSRGEARRLIQQGGVSVDGEKVEDIAAAVPASDFEKGQIILKKGKKVFHKAIKG